MGWADNLANRSSHRSAQSYARNKGVERALNDTQRRQGASDAWGMRYGQEIDSVRRAGEKGLRGVSDAIGPLDGFDRYGNPVTQDAPDFRELNALKPGTPEFSRRYIPPAEPCETLAPHGPEGFAVISRDDVPLETPEPIKIGWGESK